MQVSSPLVSWKLPRSVILLFLRCSEMGKGVNFHLNLCLSRYNFSINIYPVIKKIPWVELSHRSVKFEGCSIIIWVTTPIYKRKHSCKHSFMFNHFVLIWRLDVL